jgi:iron complex transport system ATP-binding protein
MLSAHNISYEVGGKILLAGVTLKLEPGKMNLIIGPNGAGKSTLMRVLSGLDKSGTGEVLYGEKNVSSLNEIEMAKVRAVLSQNIEVAFPMQVHEIVMMGRYPHFKQAPTKADLQICEEAMDLFDVTEFRNRNYLTLSGGEKQRVQFARVCAQIWNTGQDYCRYLLLDEPLTFLDIHYQLSFMQKIAAMLDSGNLVVAGVLHDLNLAIKYADHIILLQNGRLLAQGKKEDVISKANIQTAFCISPEILRNDLEQISHLLF